MAETSEREISEEEAKALWDDPAVVEVEHHDQPEGVAEKFVEVLASLGIDVEVLVPPNDIPSVFYRLKRSDRR